MAVLARIQIIPSYVADLRQITGLYIGYISTDVADLAENYYEILKNDDAVAHGMHLLSLMVAGEYFEVKAANNTLQEVIEFCCANIRDFVHVRKSLAYSAILFGLGVMRKRWREVYWKGLKWQVPYEIREIDRRRLRIERGEKDRNEMYWTLWDPRRDRYIVLEDRALIPNVEIAVQDFIWYIHEYEEMNPYFRGFGEILWQAVYIKSKIIQYWADLCESWAKPFLVVLLDAAKAAFDAGMGTGFPSAADRINQIFTAFEKARSRHMVVMDNSDKLEYHEKGSVGNNIIRELHEYLDKKIELLILGAELTTQAPSVGSYALGQLHRGATQSIVAYNRTRLEDVLEQELIQDFLYRNRLNLLAMGFREFPRIDQYKLQIKVEAEEKRKEAIEDNGAGSKLAAQI